MEKGPKQRFVWYIKIGIEKMHPHLYFFMLLWKPKWLAWWFSGREHRCLTYNGKEPKGMILSESEELGYQPYGISSHSDPIKSQAIHCLKIKTALLFPEGVWINPDGFSKLGLKYPSDGNTFHGFFVLHSRLNRKVRKVDSGVLLYNRWSIKNYYHWMTETVPRLSVWAKHPWATKIPLLLPENPPSYCIESIHALNPNLPVLFFNGANELLKVNKLYFITEPWLDIPSGKLMRKMVKELCPSLSVQMHSGKKIIFALRKQGQSRSIENLVEIKSALVELEIEYVDFESKSFLEQIAIMRGAKGLVGVHGANLTNLMFLPSNSWVIEISYPTLQNPPWNRFCYRHLAQACNAKHSFFLDTEACSDMDGPVRLNVPNFRLAIEAEMQHA